MMMGVILDEGDPHHGVNKAFNYFSKSAEKGHPGAILMLAKLGGSPLNAMLSVAESHINLSKTKTELRIILGRRSQRSRILYLIS